MGTTNRLHPVRLEGLSFCVLLAAVLGLIPETGQAQAGRPAGRLTIVVLDPSGAAIPHADVRLTRVDHGETDVAIRPDDERWTTERLEPGTYRAQIAAVGFRTVTVDGIRIGETSVRRVVRLALDPLAETVIVRRDGQTIALDPRGFSTFLSREQIDALPDDPAELARVLLEMAPPGAVLRIDGFSGGMLPSRSQILSIRLPRIDSFAAQEHGGLSAFSAIDIVTTPGNGRLQGSAELSSGVAALNGRDPFAPAGSLDSSAATGATLEGPVVRERLSFAAAARRVTRADFATIQAALPAGVYATTFSRPTTVVSLSGRLTAAIGHDQTLRAGVSSEYRVARKLGVGEYNLEERAYDSSSLDNAIRLALGGPWGARRFLESRLQLRWAGTRDVSAVEAPAIQVLESFTAGGAQATAGARSFRLQAASDLDYTVGAHAWRTGFLIDSGAYRVNRRTNYLGTYLFSSLADYDAGRPALFTRRLGDARTEYHEGQLGAYVQDDVRVARSLLLSYGVRFEWQRLAGDRVKVLPRASATWSPFRTGRSTFRFSWGRFTDWFPADVVEQSLLVNGEHQFDIRIPYPLYPVADESRFTSPPETYSIGPDVGLPNAFGYSVGTDQRLTLSSRLFVSYAIRHARGLLRGTNRNPVVNGQRLDPYAGNEIASIGDAESRTHTATAQFLYAPPRRGLDVAVTYIRNVAASNTAGPFSMPPDGRTLDEEWGPVGSTHAASGSVTLRGRGLTGTLAPRWRSGIPYTLTVPSAGADGFYNVRPSGAGRNGERTPDVWELGARLAYSRQFGPIRNDDPVLTGGDVSALSGGMKAARRERRFRFEVFVAAQNVSNRLNYLSMGRVADSPFYGRPVAVAPPRSVEVGARLGF